MNTITKTPQGLNRHRTQTRLLLVHPVSLKTSTTVIDYIKITFLRTRLQFVFVLAIIIQNFIHGGWVSRVLMQVKYYQLCLYPGCGGGVGANQHCNVGVSYEPPLQVVLTYVRILGKGTAVLALFVSRGLNQHCNFYKSYEPTLYVVLTSVRILPMGNNCVPYLMIEK